jgi:hypothetical protein
MKGQRVIDWGAFYIPKRATGVRGSAKVSPPCQNATTTTTTTVPATTYPDGTRTHPPPGDKAAVVEEAVTGNGPSTFNNPFVDFFVSFTNPKPLHVSQYVAGPSAGTRRLHGRLIDRFPEGAEVSYEIQIYNPNERDVVAKLTDELPRGFKVSTFFIGLHFRMEKPIACEEVGRELRCPDIHIPPGRAEFITVKGRFNRTGESINRATASGVTTDGAPLPRSNEAAAIAEIVPK